jgi:hypothetical protein
VLNPDDHTIIGFQVLPGDGMLKSSFTLPGARAMSVDPDGRWLYVSAQETPTLETYRISPEDGSLTPVSAVEAWIGSESVWNWIWTSGRLEATKDILFSYEGSWNWRAYRVDQQTGALRRPSSSDWGVRGEDCRLAVGPSPGFAYADCDGYTGQFPVLRTWSIDPEGRWQEVGHIQLQEHSLTHTVCDERLLVLDDDGAVGGFGISVYAADSATGRWTYLARTRGLGLSDTSPIACGPNDVVATGVNLFRATGVHLFRVDKAGAVYPLGVTSLAAYEVRKNAYVRSVAFHPSGRFLYVWGTDYALSPPQPSVITLSVSDTGELQPFAQTPVPGASDERSFGGQIVVTRPVP